MSLSDYLVGKNSNPGAHEKYRPDDMVPSHARLLIKVSVRVENNLFCVNLIFIYYFLKHMANNPSFFVFDINSVTTKMLLFFYSL